MFRPFGQIALGIIVWATLVAQPAHSLQADWRWFEIPQSNTRLEYPAGVLAPAGPSEKGIGESLRSADGNVRLSVYAQPNRKGETPVSYLENNLRLNPIED
jgi:hypothetical protein